MNHRSSPPHLQPAPGDAGELRGEPVPEPAGMTRDAAAPGAAETLHHASGNHVVVAIGIDRYAAWPHLGNAVNDARRTSALFGSLGFIESSGLYDEAATGSALRKLVTDDLHTLGVSDSLVVFFAGHGGTRMQRLQDGTEIQTGYIIPIDADNKQGEVASWIRLDTWLADIARLPPNHILVILDACHSGIALDSLIRWRDVTTWRSEPEDSLSRRRSRKVIASARSDELALDGGPVVGHSLFTGCLLQALAGGLSGNTPCATGSELALYLQKRVREYPHSRQTPDFGAFELDDRGEMMLPRQRPLVVQNLANPRPLRPAVADPPGAATWSHLRLQLRWPQTKDDNETLVTDHDELLQAIVTLQWSGARPGDPLLEVTSSKFFGRTVPLLHETTLRPSPDPNTATWQIRIPVPRTRLRSRQVTVRCVDTAVVERRYLVPRSGAALAALLWLAFAAFAFAWLFPISPVLFGAPVTALGIASGLWSWLGRHLLAASRSRAVVQSVFSMWERGLVVTSLAAALVVLVPPHFVVLVTNTTGKPVRLSDGTMIPQDPGRRVYLASRVRDWNPDAPFCRCGDPQCECAGSTPASQHGVNHISLGCMSGNCDGVTEHVPGATIIRPLGVTLLPLTIDAGMASSRMTVSAGPLTVTVKDITQSGTLQLPIAPSSPRFSIQFAGDGTLECLAGATRVTGFAIDPPLGMRTAISIDGATSTWTRGISSTNRVRACATGSSVARSAIVAFGDDDGAEAGRVDCSGGVIERVAVMRVAPPTGSFWVRVGDIESRWSSRVAASDARVCIGTPGDIELGPVAAGHQVTLPADGATSQLRVRRASGDASSAVSVRCRQGGTLRGISLVGSGPGQTFTVGDATIERIDARTGVTCDPPTSQTVAQRSCALGDDRLTCMYTGPCRLRTDGVVTAGASSDTCPRLAGKPDAQRARDDGRRQTPPLECKDVYRCE